MSIAITLLSLVLFILAPIKGLAPCFAESALPGSRPLGKSIRSIQSNDLPNKHVPPFYKEPTGKITLDDVLSLTLMNNPELATFSWELRAQDAAVFQAGLFPNPELHLEMENIFGSNGLRRTDQAETTLSLTQRIETAGKRTKRENLAALNRDLAGWGYESKRLDLFTELSQRFIDVLGNQEKLALSEALLSLATQVAETVTRRVDAGKVSPVEAVKARIALSSAKIELTRATQALDASRKTLAAMWGSPHPKFDQVAGPLAPASRLPDFEQILDRLSQNPEVAREESTLSQGQAALDLEKAKAVPDITFAGGVRQFNETDDNAFLAGLTFELPVFDRNQGGIRSARAKVSKALAQNHATKLRLKTALVEAYTRLSSRYSEVEGLKNELLPGAVKAFDAVNEGYRLGKFDLLDVLDAQRTLSQARSQFLQAQIDYHKAVVDVERLIAEKLNVGKVPHEGE